jgi:phosphatidylserine/phosphatidylglycerophosphate/cardiolipin synthase-like enzyme
MLLGAVESQDRAKQLLSFARGRSKVMLSGFTFDRSDIVDLLLTAHSCNAEVRVLLDEGNTLGGQTRNTVSEVMRLVQGGIAVRTLQGQSVLEAYREVGRSVASHIRGIHHSKSLRVDNWMVVGSCNWTTSSRSNFETGALLRFKTAEILRVDERLDASWAAGTEVTAELLRANSEPRRRSVSVRR